MDDHVGPEAAVLGVHGDLLGEIAARRHARRLDDAAEVHFAPESDGLRRAERAGEVARLALDLVLAVAEERGLLAEFRVGLVQDQETFLVALERFGERLEDFLDGLAALLEVAVLLRDERLQVRAREADELGAVGLERLAGERLEGLLEFSRARR